MLGFGQTGTVNDKAECGQNRTVDNFPESGPSRQVSPANQAISIGTIITFADRRNWSVHD
jgi:hypothetical protein